MIISVPVKPYVRHLLIEHFGKSPIPIRANSDIGQFFLLAIQNSVFLKLNFGWVGQKIPEHIDEYKDFIDKEVLGDGYSSELALPEGLMEMKFEVGGKLAKGVIMPDLLLQIGVCLESYCRIYMKGFSHGYRTLFNSSRSSAMVFHRLFGFDEKDLSLLNIEKIFLRENAEMKDPIDGARKSFRVSKKEQVLL